MLIENEFARVKVDMCAYGNGQRLRIEDAKTGVFILLDPLELEGLAWASLEDLDLFVNPARMRRWRDIDTKSDAGG